MGLNDSDELLTNRKLVVCEKCQGSMYYVDNGVYKCYVCGHEELDNLGKIKKFLAENGPSPVPVISSATGVPTHVIEQYLREGRADISSDSISASFRCKKCGCMIQSGRYCISCVQELAGGIQKMFDDDRKNKPLPQDVNNAGKMHFFKDKT